MKSKKSKSGGKTGRKPDLSQFSKWMIADIRPLLWIVTIGGFYWHFIASTRGTPALFLGSALWLVFHGLPMVPYAVSI